jgi:class III poly(R)-hydroxyalkanoic acid synthase PhaE subunit
MADPKAAWMPDWQSMQKQFFSAWTDAARTGGTQSMPVHEGFDVWLKLFNNNSNNSGNEVLDKVVGSAKQFAEFMQGVVGQLATTRPDLSTPGAMREALEKAMGGLTANKNPVIDALRGISSEGAKGFEDMQREWMKLAKPLESDARAYLQMPAFGMNREATERQQALMQAFADFQEQNSRYNAVMFKASRLGLDKFESKLAERSEPGRQITSMRALYDLYVDAAEEGYAEVALSDEFREVYGALVNSQMRVRQMVQGEIERSTAALGIPGRTELDSVHKRLAEMRRRIAHLEEKLEALSGAAPTPMSEPKAAPKAVAPAKKAMPKQPVKSAAKVTAAQAPAPTPAAVEPEPAAEVKAHVASKATKKPAAAKAIAAAPKSTTRRSRS